jgi:hypothetical protein
MFTCTYIHANVLSARVYTYTYIPTQENHIPVPRHIIVSRDFPGQQVPGFEEDHDSVQMDGEE